MTKRGAVVLIASDLVVAGAAAGALQAAGYAVLRLDPALTSRDGDDLADPPSAVVLDLDARDFDPTEVGERARARWPGVRVVGVVQHVHRERIERARAAGWDRIVPRSRLSQLAALVAS